MILLQYLLQIWHQICTNPLQMVSPLFVQIIINTCKPKVNEENNIITYSSLYLDIFWQNIDA